MSEVVSVTRRGGRLLVCLDLQQASLVRRAGADRCIINCRRMLAHARAAGWRIVHVHTKQANPRAARPIEGLEPLPTEPLLYRSGGSAFSSATFRRLVAEAPCELVVVGYSPSASCLATTLIAHDENVSVTLVEDAVSATLDADTRYAIAVVSRQMARPMVELTSTSALIGPPRLLRVV